MSLGSIAFFPDFLWLLWLLIVSIALYFRNKGFIADDDLSNATMPPKPVPEGQLALFGRPGGHEETGSLGAEGLLSPV